MTALRIISTAPPLARRNIQHGNVRSLAAICGICFSLVMVLLQLGFFEAVKITANNIYSELDFDVAIVARDYEHLYEPGSFPTVRLRQASGLPAVSDVRPLFLQTGYWRCPPRRADTSSEKSSILQSLLGRNQGSEQFQLRQLLVIGVDLTKVPFKEPNYSRLLRYGDRLLQDRRVLLNELSNSDFGWSQRKSFTGWELNGQRVDVVGGFELMRGFAADAHVLCSEENFRRYCRLPRPHHASVGLVRVQPAGLVESTVEQLNQILPVDVEVMTRQELIRREQRHWVRNTATGKIFAFGVFVSLLVAAVVVYQVLSNDIRNRVTEYATLKAVGHSDSYLQWTVLQQGLLYVLISFAPALLIGWGVYRLTADVANIPMVLTLTNIGWTLLLATVVGAGSALLSVRRIRAANPADLF